MKIFRIDYEYKPFNTLFFVSPSLVLIGCFVGCSSGGKYFENYLHLVDFHYHLVDFDHRLFERSFLQITKNTVSTLERVFNQKKIRQ